MVGSYLVLKIRATREFGLERIRQPCFAKSAKLKFRIFQNPIPPLSFEVHNFFQEVQHTPFSRDWFLPH